ncbi:MAG: cobalt-precorrin-5B (C(1))-methyltransferase CbiD, partial [Cyanobacteria bacterium P01_F01_bin.42]
MDNKATSVRSGFTLPVFACAAAIAAYRKLSTDTSPQEVIVDLIHPNQTVSIPVEQVARLDSDSVLAITRSDPGENLDLTRHTPVWARVEWQRTQNEPIQIDGGEGVGRHARDADDAAAIYSYAHQLLHSNLMAAMNENHQIPDRQIKVTIILPEGERLAQRTSNEAFGVVGGLSLLGTSGISQALSAPAQLEAFLDELRQKAQPQKPLVFCLGENGLDIARRIGVPTAQLLKTANWIGPMLALAGQERVPAVLLLGYHGKLIKLAGGIFHTHHHLADGRQEILTAIAAGQGLGTQDCQHLLACRTLEDGLKHLQGLKHCPDGSWSQLIYREVTARIESRAQ